MRWLHPEEGFIPPDRFIRLGEETGMILEMGRWAMQTSLADHARLVERFGEVFPGADTPFVSVNLSSRQIAEAEEVRGLKDVIRSSGLPPAAIKLEVTESLMVHDPDLAGSMLAELKDTGVSLAIDDFGTGYSSLSYLHRFPFDTLKVDRAFVMNMSEDPGSRRLVRTIIDMGRDLGLKVVAEGIETRQEYDLLAGMGCDYGQGYFMARPGPRSDVEDLIASGPTW